jgi:hypothetical protein
MEIMISTESGLLCYGNDEHPRHPTAQILRIIPHRARSLSTAPSRLDLTNLCLLCIDPVGFVQLA